MSFQENTYPFPFQRQPIHKEVRSNQSTVSCSSTVIALQDVVKELFAEQKAKQRRPLLSWPEKILKQKTKTVCHGKMLELNKLVEMSAEWIYGLCADTSIPEPADYEDTVELFKTILNYVRLQKFTIVSLSGTAHTKQTVYNGIIPEILALYAYFRKTGTSNPYSYDNKASYPMFKDECKEVMCHMALMNDWSLDRICDSILKIPSIQTSPVWILGELIIGLLDECIRQKKNPGHVMSQPMDTLTFVRVMLVFKRFLRWYSAGWKSGGYIYRTDPSTLDQALRKRLDFCMSNIVPPPNLKEVLLLLSRHRSSSKDAGKDVLKTIYSEVPFNPPEDKVLMNNLLKKNFSTSDVYKNLESILLEENVFPLFGVHQHHVTLEPLHTSHESMDRVDRSRELKECAASVLDKPRTDEKWETRLSTYSLCDLNRYCSYRRLCLTPTHKDICPPSTGEVAGYLTPPGSHVTNPQSVQSVDSDSSHNSYKISSTTVIDSLDTPCNHQYKMPLGTNMFPGRNVAMTHLHGMNIAMASIVTCVDGVKKAVTPCFVLEEPSRPQSLAPTNQPGSHMDIETSSTDEDGSPTKSTVVGPGTLSLVARASLHQQNKPAPTRMRMGVGNKKRKGERGVETVPGKRPRHCPNGLVDPSHGPPLKSVIVHTDPSKVTASTPGEGEGPAPNLAGKSSGPGAQNAAGSEEFFPDLDQVPDYDHEDLMQGHQKNSNLFLLPLREVEGNHSSEANDATHVTYKKQPGPVPQSMGSASHHHTNPDSPMFQNSRGGTGSPHVGGPLLNNAEVGHGAPCPSRSSGPAGHHGAVSQQGDYPQQEDCNDFYPFPDGTDWLGEPFSQKTNADQDVSDDGKTNTRTGKQAHRTGRRAAPVNEQAAANNRRKRAANTASTSHTRAPASRENSVEPSPTDRSQPVPNVSDPTIPTSAIPPVKDLAISAKSLAWLENNSDLVNRLDPKRQARIHEVVKKTVRPNSSTDQPPATVSASSTTNTTSTNPSNSSAPSNNARSVGPKPKKISAVAERNNTSTPSMDSEPESPSSFPPPTPTPLKPAKKKRGPGRPRKPAAVKRKPYSKSPVTPPEDRDYEDPEFIKPVQRSRKKKDSIKDEKRRCSGEGEEEFNTKGLDILEQTWNTLVNKKQIS